MESRKHLTIAEVLVLLWDIVFGRMVADMDLRILVGHIGCLLVVVVLALGDIDLAVLLGDILRT